MNKKTVAIGLASAALTAMVVAAPTLAQGLGYGWGNGGVPPRGEEGERPVPLSDDTRGKRPELTEEMETHRAAAEAAIAAGDYTAWVAAMGDSPIVEQVTAAEFPRYMQMWNLMNQARDLTDQARTIGEEIGLEHAGFGGYGQPGPGRGLGHGPNRTTPTGSTETAED